MAANKIVRFGPVALSNTLTTNILNPQTVSGGTITSGSSANATSSTTYIILRHIRVVNKTAGAVTCSFWIGGSAGNVAGTEFMAQGLSVAANSYIDWYGAVVLQSADFLVGGASAATSLSWEAEGEIGVS